MKEIVEDLRNKIVLEIFKIDNTFSLRLLLDMAKQIQEDTPGKQQSRRE